MTGPARRIPTRRASDKGILGRVRAWWDEWGQLLMGAWLLVVSAVVLWVAVSFYQSQRDTAQAAKVACQRSKKLGPQIADYYARDPAFPQDVLVLYRRTIPKTCPR